MIRWASALVCTAAVFAADPAAFRASRFAAAPGGLPPGWRIWSPRGEIAPRAWVDTVRNRGEDGALALSGGSNPAVCGGWEYLHRGIVPGRWYRFSVCFRAEGPQYDPLQVLPRLDWAEASGKRAGRPDYAWRTVPDGEWTRVTLDAPAPENAAAVRIQLLLLNAPATTVWWDEISLDPIPAPAPRPVTLASVNLRPSRTASSADSVGRFIALIEKSAPAKTDVILLPEGITVVGTGKKYADVAEAVPGPTTDRLGELARRRGTYIAAGIYEREGAAVYNTAVLIDRQGRLAGRYRKVYIPREEMEGGITPGSDYPVFDTDFGRVGMMICWDVQYADPARALALRGAEIILMPIWGGNETLARARAIENHVFLAASGYGFPTVIFDPAGEMVARAPGPASLAVATLDLSRRYLHDWLGHMRDRFMKELRLDVPVVRAR